MTAGLIFGSLGAGAAMAAPDDRSEAEGLFLSGAGLIDLDTVAELAGAYQAYLPGGATSADIDVEALGLVDLGLGVSLFGGNDVLTLGAVGQYSRADASGAFASSGLIGADGAIQVGTGDPAQNTTLNLAPVLSAVGVQQLINNLTLELGAVSASAQATRLDDTVTTEGDYQIASGRVVLTSPVLAQLSSALDATLTTSSAAVNALAADGGQIDSTVNGLLGGIDDILDGLLLGLVNLDEPSVNATLAVDLGAALDAVSDDAFTRGPVTVTLGTGEIIVDLDELYALNDLGVNTSLLSDAGLNPTIAEALSHILTTQLPTALETALVNVLNTTSLDISINAGVDTILGSIGTLSATIDGTLGGFLGTTGSALPSVSLEGTEIVDLEVGELLQPITDFAATSIVPPVGAILGTALNVDALEAGLTATLTSAIATIQPVLSAIDDVVAITVNVRPGGDFRDERGLDAGAFTQRAVSLAVAPGLAGGIVLNVASATVRAVPMDAPAGLTMTPVRGPVTGGTLVTITGENLADVTEILFGTIPVGAFTVDDDGAILTTAPAQVAPGAVPVTVTNPDGSDTTLTFEYYAVTAVSSIDPDSGSTAGGDPVTIIGSCFTGATGVLFDGEPGTELTVVSDTEITVTTPAGTAGPADVTITNPTDCGDITVPDGFTYVEPGAPALSDIDPPTGPETGGTVVTITGEDFTGATSVTFDGIEADFEVISDTEIEATTPPHAPGAVDVIVTNEAGASAPLDFEFYNVADVDDVVPGTGPESGGNTVVITGDCFTGATGVTFGGVPATSFIVDSDTQITAVVPAGTGIVDVTVIGAAACGTDTVDDGYEYVAPPVVTDLDPASGPETGGTVVTITGEGFTDATGVAFGENPGVEFTVVSDTEIEVTTPAGVPGVVPVTVLHPGGAVDAGDFEYLDVPTVTTMDPVQGPEDGGTVVNITGEGFTGATGVTFDGIDGTAFTVVSDTEIEVTTPAHAPATVPVVIEHPVTDAEAGDFTFLAGTEIDDIEPGTGPESGGNTVVITGSCFTGATGVTFGGVPATSFIVDSDTQITAVVPAGTGIVDVAVIGAAACGTDTVDDGYEYSDDPIIGSLEPSAGPETGGTVVTIEGSNFTGVTSVTFDGAPGTDLTVISDTELTVTTPAGTPGMADVVVTSPDGASDPGDFEYYPVTVVDGTDPDEGPTGGGTLVTITGQCFTGATGVLFGGVASPQWEIVNDTTIRALTPAASGAGPVDITVVGAGTCGDGLLEDGFTYVPGPAAGGSLPATGMGADVAPWTLFGALLLLAGAFALIWRRRTA